MEKDGKSRLYITSASNPAWQQLPEEEATEYESRLQGDEALAVIERADFYCINYSAYTRGPDGAFGPKLEDQWLCRDCDENRFQVDRMTWKPSEHYTKLVEVLEARTGKSGLTILVS